MFTYHPAERFEVRLETNISASSFDDAGKKKYKRVIIEQMNDAREKQAKVKLDPSAFVILSSDNVSRSSEAINEAKAIVLKAMLNEITMEEFDKKADEFIKKYQPIIDEYNRKIPEAKAKYGL